MRSAGRYLRHDWSISRSLLTCSCGLPVCFSSVDVDCRRFDGTIDEIQPNKTIRTLFCHPSARPPARPPARGSSLRRRYERNPECIIRYFPSAFTLISFPQPLPSFKNSMKFTSFLILVRLPVRHPITQTPCMQPTHGSITQSINQSIELFPEPK